MTHRSKQTVYSIIDDLGHLFNKQQLEYRDAFNNYTFSVTKTRGSTFISPSPKDYLLTELKVGVLMPFHQDSDEITRMMTLSGISAIRLAVAEINTRHLIPGAYITLIERDSYPKSIEGHAAMSQAVFSAMSLIQEGIVGMIGDISSSWTSLSALLTSTLQIPQCSFSAVATSLSDKSQFGYFFRTVPTKLLYPDAAVHFIQSQGWSEIGVLYSDDDFGKQLSESLILKARRNGIQVTSYECFYQDGSPSDIRKSLNSIMSTGVRIFFVAAKGDAQTAAFVVAAHENYMNDRNVWMTPELDADTLGSAVHEYNAILSNQTTVQLPLDGAEKENSKLAQHPIAYVAKTATRLTLIDYEASFSGGIFSLEGLRNLSGYAPYDTFFDKWSQLDPTIYPYSGSTNGTSNEGLAYSCMMVLANGFNQTINDTSSSNQNQGELLEKLANGQLGQYLTPSAFNTSFVGPDGPMALDQNGDVVSGNFKLCNIQKGFSVGIGTIIAGNLNLTSLPIYHDGTTKIPASTDDIILLNLDYSTPVITAFVVVISLGVMMTLSIFVLVLLFRKRPVFMSSNPLFCMLKLVGFLFTYVSVFLFVGPRTHLTCTLMPITFHLGYILIVGNIIAKNYQIYRIFNNVFISKTAITDRQLLKLSGPILFIYAILLAIFLSTSKISMANISVSKDAYYIGCSYSGAGHTVFDILLTIVGALQMVLVVFLAFRIRKIAKTHSKYIEYKYIIFSVYNLFFSTLISFAISSIPSIGYYTRHYLVATMVLWATSFSLLVFFVPKLYAFFAPENKLLHKISDKACDLSGKLRHRKKGRSQAAVGVAPEKTTNPLSLDPTKYPHSSHIVQQDTGEDPSSLSQFNQHPSENSTVRLNHLTEKCSTKEDLMDIYEMKAPVQVVFSYFPFLAAWEMMHIVLMPNICYFSCYNEKASRGKVFSYSNASILINQPNEYVLKVHGVGMYDIIIQVESEADLSKWNDWFNISLTHQSQHNFLKQVNQDTKTVAQTRQSRANSCMTTQCLLSAEDDLEEETRRGSDTTFKTALSESLYPLSLPPPTLSRYRIHQATRDQVLQDHLTDELLSSLTINPPLAENDPVHPLCATQLSASLTDSPPSLDRE